jgi:hypothetical protein
MASDDLAKGRQLSQSNLKETVRLVAPKHGVDSDELLKKLPKVPVDPSDPGQLAAYLAELRLKGEELTIEEAEVMQEVSQIMIEIIRGALRAKHSNLPEFSE